MSTRQHVVSVVCNGAEVRGWSSYDIRTSMVDPVDTFTLEMPFSRAAWDLLATDSPVRVVIDGVVVIDGFIDDIDIPEGDDLLQLSGRDRCGRLVNESAPGIDFRGMDMLTLVGQLASPWFDRVTLSNARNREVLRGKGKKARAGREPVFVTTGKGNSIEPGQTRWQVIEDLCQQAELLCWSAGDGRELIIGRPNYDQAPQFHFFMPAAKTTRAADANVLGLGQHRSTGDRYSEIIVVGTGRGTDANYGAAVTSRVGRAVNLDGFSAPKRLVLEKAVGSIAEATAWANQEMARRDAQGRKTTVRAPLHGQIVAGRNFTIFTPDLVVSIEDERIGTRGMFLMTACTYRSNRNGGEETSIDVAPMGQELAI